MLQLQNKYWGLCSKKWWLCYKNGSYVGLVTWLEWILILPVGAPEYTYVRGLFKSVKKAGIDFNNGHELTHDKTKWRKNIYDIWFLVYYY